MSGQPTYFAVYGTLRPGCGNDVLWHGLAFQYGTARVDGYRLVTHGYFPYAIPDPDSSVVVDILSPHADTCVEMGRRLDRLEGVDHGHYERVTVTVYVPDVDREITATMYVPCDPDRYADLDLVPDGDWCYGADEPEGEDLDAAWEATASRLRLGGRP